MKLLSGLTSQPRQSLSFIPEDGFDECVMTLWFSPAQRGWYADFEYAGRTITGVRLACFPNVLRPWKNVLAFGIAVDTTNGFDPTTVSAFADGAASLYVLGEADLARIEAEVFARG